MQATVRSFDPVTGSGSVFLDDGGVLDFGREAFAASGLLRLRRGQRVSLVLDADGVVRRLWLSTVPMAEEGPP
jgi:cold shock CspA family protein